MRTFLWKLAVGCVACRCAALSQTSRGTVTGTRGVHGTGCNPTWEFTYSASLRESGAGDNPFPILYSPDPYNGLEYGGAAGYAETLSGMYDLPACDGHPGCTTGLTRSGDYGVLAVQGSGFIERCS